MYCTVIPGKRLPWYHRNTLITTTSITRQHGRSTGTMPARSAWTVSTTCRRSSPVELCVRALVKQGTIHDEDLHIMPVFGETDSFQDEPMCVKSRVIPSEGCAGGDRHLTRQFSAFWWQDPGSTHGCAIRCQSVGCYDEVGVGLVVTQWLTQTTVLVQGLSRKRGVWLCPMLPMMGQILSKKEGHQRKKVSLVGCSEILLIKVTVSELC